MLDDPHRCTGPLGGASEGYGKVPPAACTELRGTSGVGHGNKELNSNAGSFDCFNRITAATTGFQKRTHVHARPRLASSMWSLVLEPAWIYFSMSRGRRGDQSRAATSC